MLDIQRLAPGNAVPDRRKHHLAVVGMDRRQKIVVVRLERPVGMAKQLRYIGCPEHLAGFQVAVPVADIRLFQAGL